MSHLEGTKASFHRVPTARCDFERSWGVQDGLGIVLVLFVFLFDPPELLLGPSCIALGTVLGCLGLSWVRFGTFRRAFWSLQPLLSPVCSSCSFFLLSSHGPRNCHTLLNPGPAECAIELRCSRNFFRTIIRNIDRRKSKTT